MVRRWVAKSLVGLSCLGMAACSGNQFGGGKPAEAKETSRPTLAELGPAIFKADPPEKIEPSRVMREPITIGNAVVRLDKKQIVPAQVDGYIEVIGVPLPPGTPYNPTDKDIILHQLDLSKNEKTAFRRLREGDKVALGQIVAVFNDLEVAVAIEANQKIVTTCQEGIKMAKKGADYIQQQLDLVKGFKDMKAMSAVEILNLQATLARYEENVITSEREKVKAEGDEKKAWAMLSKHRARADVNGIVTKVMRAPGEFLKAGEPIMEILATDEEQVEGNLDAKDAWAVTPGMKVTVEPVTPIGPDPGFGSIDHRLDVTGVAVTAHKGRPLVVSASLDGTAAVWDLFPPADKVRTQVRLQHPVGVRSVACTGPKAGTRHLIATGGDDGKVRFWDTTNPDKLASSDKPTRETEESHPSAVTSLSFSPDGRYLASAAGRDVWVWDAATGKKLYALPPEHKDAVTAIRFTPQATLVTVARDRAVRVWAMREKGAALEKTIDHRKGNVDQLGLSKEGGRVLFDQDDGRIDVVNLADGRPLGSIQNAAASARFATLAIFSADDSLVLTANAGGDSQGELQLWKAPQPGGRGSEYRRLVTPGRTTPTCAAFSQDETHRFVVVGTQAGRVHVWTREANDAMAKTVRPGKVTSVIRLDPKTVKVRVETETTPGEVLDLFQDKGSATIIIDPVEPGTTPRAEAPVPPAPGGVVQAGGAVAQPANPVVHAAATGSGTAIAPPTGPLTTPQVQPMSGSLSGRLTPEGTSSTAPPPKPAGDK
jgi:WD40 repeat protein